MLETQLTQIKQVFQQLGIEWVEPYTTTVETILDKRAGMHRGLYWIYPEKNFYFGLAKSKNTLIATKRMDTHILKLTVDLATLYGAKGKDTSPKVEPYKQFPEGWKAAVRKYIVEDAGPIPSHWKAVKHPTKRKWCEPGILEYPVQYRVDPYKLTVIVWNLNHLTPQQIKDIEHSVIHTIWPYANSETHSKRLREGVE